jgi:hypothetical protein
MPASQGRPIKGVRPVCLIGTVSLVLAVVAICVAMRAKKPLPAVVPQAPAQQEELPADALGVAAAHAAPADEQLPKTVTNAAVAVMAAEGSPLAVKRQPPVTAPQATRPEPSAYTRQLAGNLVSSDPSGLPKTPEQIAAWKQNLQTLIQQGGASLPAIQEFLEKNTDFAFEDDSARALGYGSTRSAMYDALVQIGGADAANVLLDTLRASADPGDIANIARSLEQLGPEQYRQQILDASRQVLAMAAGGKASQTDVAPLFQVLERYGGAGAVPEIVQASAQWKYYSAIALAQLPEAAGVPALIQMVQDSGGGQVKNVAALEMLTQLAAQNADARAALLQQVRANNLSPYAWSCISSLLAGDQVQFQNSAPGSPSPTPTGADLRTFHLAAGNQNFYFAPPAGGLTADQINQQVALLDELNAAASNPTALQILQNSRATLLSRSSGTTATAR